MGGAVGVCGTLLFQHLAAPVQPEPARPYDHGAGLISIPVAASPSAPSPDVLHQEARPPPPETPNRSSPENRDTTVPITPGFERLLARAPDSIVNYPAATLHARLGAEVRDNAWAAATEDEIKTSVDGYLDQHGFDRHTIEVPVVRCGSTICEIQAQGPLDGTPRDWQQVVPYLMQGPFGQDFSARDGMTSVFELQNGQTGFVTFLFRRKDP